MTTAAAETTFSPERIQRALDDFRAFLRGDRREPIISVLAPADYRQATDPERIISGACAQIQADAASGEPHALPTFWPDFGTVTTAALWGGQRIPAPEGGGAHIEPILQSVADLAELAPPRIAFGESDFQRALDLHRQVCERLGTGDVFIRTPDLQGPLNTLALLMDQTELMCAMTEEPAAVERALDLITDTLIDYVGKFRAAAGPTRVIGNIWPFVVLPDGQGIGITQDYMPLLGAELYARFELPRLKRIADAFGGVWIHCCGEFAQHLPALRAADFKIWGLELHYPCTKIWDAHAALGDRVAYTPYVAPTGAAEFPSLVEFVRSLAGRPCAAARYWFCVCPGWCEIPALRQAVAAALRPG